MQDLFTPDLFAQDGQWRRLPLPDAEICQLSDADWLEGRESLLRALIEDTPWRAEEIILFGKRCPQPRLTAWYGDRGSRYRYSGLDLEPLPWTETLASLRRAVESACDARFNSVLLNYYRDGRDAMGLHSDDEAELGPAPVIASLSLGETRTFMLKHRRRKDVPPVKLPLESGSLLLMKGATQRNWKHGVSRERDHCGARVNLTFRRIVHAPG